MNKIRFLCAFFRDHERCVADGSIALRAKTLSTWWTFSGWPNKGILRIKSSWGTILMLEDLHCSVWLNFSQLHSNSHIFVIQFTLCNQVTLYSSIVFLIEITLLFAFKIPLLIFLPHMCMQDIWCHIHSLMPIQDAARAACVSQTFFNSFLEMPP